MDRPEDSAQRLLAVIAELHRETHPGRRLEVALSSDLERDLGFDSLTRMEMLLRLERAFGQRLAEAAVAGAETIADLLALLRLPAPAAAPEAPAAAGGDAALPPLPADVATLVDALAWHAGRHPERIHLIFVDPEAGEQALGYGALQAGAQAVAAGLAARGLAPGEAVALMLPTGPDFFHGFLGVLLAGAVPVPIYPPARPSQLEDHLRRHAAILANAGCRRLLTSAEAKPAAALLGGLVEQGIEVVLVAEVSRGGTPAPVVPAARGEDVALLQYTSGSTGQPKGVTLSHANLLANIRAMADAAHVTSRDVFVSWLPLYHDMGLICAWLASLCFGVRYVVMSPLAFLARPERWLQAITRHRGTLSGAPNFAYELCLKRIDEAALAGLDLSSWRIAFNGAEPVSASTMRRFAERFAPCGLAPTALAPVYGLAECAVGLTVTPDRGLRVDRVRRDPFLAEGRALPAAADEPALEFVACGRPLPGHAIRVVDAAGRELPERREGRLQFRGPSATAGYYRNPEATRRLFDGDWLETGDRAYLADGELHLTGREKDIIIKGGRNIHPQEIEQAVGEIAGIRKGCVAAFGSPDPATGSERLVVVAETRTTDGAEIERLRALVAARTVDVLGQPPDEVVVSSSHLVLKTSSGKVRRAASRELYEQGGAAAPRAVWLQVARLVIAGLAPRLRRVRGTAADLLFGLRALLLFGLMALPVWALVAFLPGPSLRWNAGRAAARLFLALAGIRWRVAGTDFLPAGPAVLVANHGSYLDGLLLVAALPRSGWRFVAKRELRGNFLARTFLTGLGCLFVERFEFSQGAQDAERLVAAARAGHGLIVFPEGTFRRAAGLLPFRMGAFVVAAEAALPVVPIVIRGSRAVLADDDLLARRGGIALEVCAPIRPAGTDWAAAAALRSEARAALLARCGEPDLALPEAGA